jgi:hypothetical protein
VTTEAKLTLFAVATASVISLTLLEVSVLMGLNIARAGQRG